VPRLILILAVGAVFYLLLRRVSQLPPHKRRAEYLKIAAGAAIVIVIGLTLAGKMHWIGAAVTGLLVFMRQSLPLLLRAFPFLSQLGRSARAAPQQSTVTTDTLRMHLDHDSGGLSGEVLAGPYKDWRLDELDRTQLEELRSYCASHDPEALQLLDGYLEQRFSGEEQPRSDTGSGATGSSSGEMTRREALEVLGLGDDADRDAIVEAHRKLMQKLHPDRGGSDYLAAKINQAKDLLLGQ
jgi:hypothetical protein